MKSFVCDECFKTFKYKKGLVRHKTNAHGSAGRFKCPTCVSTFKRKEFLNRHLKLHDKPHYDCTTCGKQFYRKYKYKQHVLTHHQDECQEFFERAAVKGTLKTASIPAVHEKDPMVFLRKYKENIINRLKMEKAAVKWYLSIQVQFKKEKNEETVAPHFRGKCRVAIKPDDIEDGFKDSVKKIHQSFTDYQRQGSNWLLDYVIELTMHMVQYQPLRGSSYIHLPGKLKLKHAIINVQNRDEKCFLWAVLAALFPPVSHPQRVVKYADKIKGLDMTGMSRGKLRVLDHFDRK